MKKRLAVLALILAITSVSVADKYWSEDSVTGTIGQTLTIDIMTTSGDTYPSGPAWVGNAPSPTGVAEIVSITPGYHTGSDYVIQSPAQTGYPGWWAVDPGEDLPFPFTEPPYNQWYVSILCGSVGTYVISCDYYGSVGPDDLLTINVVPEPTTVVLLALGGLFLRRRK